MTVNDVEILLHYLSKVVVPSTEQDQFLKAFNALVEARNRAKKKAA